MQSDLAVGAILSRTIELMRSNARTALAAIGGLTLMSAILDALTLPGNNAITGAVGIFVQYTVVSEVLAKLGLMPDGYRARPFWAMLGLIILSNIMIALGLILLIIPGIYVAVRLAIAVPILIAEERGIGALRESWDRTKGHFWPIFLTLAAIFGPLLIVAVGGGLLEAFGAGLPPLAISAGTYLGIYAFTVMGWYAATAIYERLRQGRSDLDSLQETFA
jgi:uncharacterized membrane protein